jgi:hypothetical protein
VRSDSPALGQAGPAADHQAAEVFVACAGPTVAVMERLQLAQRTTFFAQQAEQVSQIQALAETVVTRGRS